MRTVCLDFDGVIHSFKSGWKRNTVIIDPPVPGVKEAIAELRKTYMVKVYSARCKHPEGKEAIEKYLAKHDIKVSAVVDHKPGAFVYIDDRGLQFKGDWTQTLKDIENFKPWLEDSTQD